MIVHIDDRVTIKALAAIVVNPNVGLFRIGCLALHVGDYADLYTNVNTYFHEISTSASEQIESCLYSALREELVGA